MCNCLKEALKNIADKYPTWPPDDKYGKKVERYSYSEAALNFKTGKMEMGIGISIKFENQKKLGHTFIRMSHCPLCGEKIC